MQQNGIAYCISRTVVHAHRQANDVDGSCEWHETTLSNALCVCTCVCTLWTHAHHRLRQRIRIEKNRAVYVALEWRNQHCSRSKMFFQVPKNSFFFFERARRIYIFMVNDTLSNAQHKHVHRSLIRFSSFRTHNDSVRIRWDVTTTTKQLHQQQINDNNKYILGKENLKIPKIDWYFHRLFSLWLWPVTVLNLKPKQNNSKIVGGDEGSRLLNNVLLLDGTRHLQFFKPKSASISPLQ